MENSDKEVSDYIYSLQRKIGHGKYGTSVYITYHKNDPNTLYVLKVIPIENLLQEETLKKQVFQSIKILRQIKGVHIAEMIDVFKNEGKIYIVMEYCDGGDFESKLSSQGTLSEEEACKILKQIALAFVEIEKKDIVNKEGTKVIVMHRSINPDHIMFKGDTVKLVDFGFAKVVTDADKHIEDTHTVGKFDQYASPQVLNYELYSSKCDIWSAGMVFYRMLFGGLPWAGRTKKKLHDEIISKPLMLPGQIKKSTEELLRKMLSVDEAMRPTWSEVFKQLP